VGGLLVEEVTRADGGAWGVARLSSAGHRSARTSANEGNGRWQVTSWAMN